MYETIVLATDGSASAKRAVTVGLDLARRFDATVHALYVLDVGAVEATPADVREDLERALQQRGRESVDEIDEQSDREVRTALRRGRPAPEIEAYAEAVEADLIVTGTRGRHGEHAFLLGSVAEAVVRQASQPVLTVRQLEDGERRPDARGAA